ncbi:MAG: membrane protein insertase YidC [Desulfovibrio sp.]|nr:MAG: membrane protein insertase YidC [Desulfovibrio sp.]
MDTKRVIIAVVLCVAVMYGWNLLFPPPERAPAPVEETETQESAPAPTPDHAEEYVEFLGDVAAADTAQGREIEVDTPLYHAVFNSQGGYLTHFQLKDYTKSVETDSLFDMVDESSVVAAPMGVLVNDEATWAEYSWDQGELGESSQGTTLTFTGTKDGMTLVRTLTFSQDTYLITEELDLTDRSGPIEGDVAFVLASRTLSAKEVMVDGEVTEEQSRYDMTRVAVFSDSAGLEDDSDKGDLEDEPLEVPGEVYWGGVQSNYFLMAVIPDQNARFVGYSANDLFITRTEVLLNQDSGEPSATCTYYLGPKEEDTLAQGPEILSAARDFGWFDFIAKPMMWGINFFNDYVKNYGLAIIIMTVLIKIVLWPLSQKSYKSMNKMKQIQPLITKLREKYKDDRQKMNEELMGLYKTYKVNPAGGCIPMILQIPVFIGLYQALLNAIELRHAVFIPHVPFTDIIWLADLSARDPFYVTPIIMGATMFIQQRLSPSMGDPTQAKIMMIMPIVFTFIFLNFPAGLVIYWLTNNVLSIVQQKMLLRSKKD